MNEPTDEELARMAAWAVVRRKRCSTPQWFDDLALKYKDWFFDNYSPETIARIKAAMEKAKNETDPRR